MKTDLLHPEESYKIIGACMEVHNQLGTGLLEAVYQEALSLEFQDRGIPFTREKELPIQFKRRVLSKKYVADFICYDGIIIEIKALDQLTSEHESQVLNYLKATGHSLGLLVNFGERLLRYKRLAFSLPV